MAVIRGVLGDEDELPHPLVHQPAGLRPDGLRRPADRGAFDQGNGAERAGAAAPVRDLQVGARPLHRGPQHPPLLPADRPFVRDVEKGLRGGAPAQGLDELQDVHPATGADHAVDPRHLLHQTGPPPLGQASGGDEQLALLLPGRELPQHPQGFLAGRLDEAAGVHDEDIGPAGALGRLIAGPLQELGHAGRVNGVLGAAQGDQMITPPGATRHSSPPTLRRAGPGFADDLPAPAQGSLRPAVQAHLKGSGVSGL
jgi:hypothetical protein